MKFDDASATLQSFEPFVTPSAGRGLRATRVIKAGEEVLNEAPVACVWSSTADDTAECIDMLAQIIMAGATARFGEPMAALLSEEELTRQKDPSLLAEVAQHA